MTSLFGSLETLVAFPEKQGRGADQNGNLQLVRQALKLFLLVFTVSHLVSSYVSGGLLQDGYALSFTFWGLLLTCAAATIPRCKTLVVTAMIYSVLCSALYYTLLKRGAVDAQSFLLHGGCAAVFFFLIASGSVRPEPSLNVAFVVFLVLFLNAGLQWGYESYAGASVYPTSRLSGPLWRVLGMPLLGFLAVLGLCALPSLEN